MQLLLRTLKSFNRKEKWVAGLFLLIFFCSSFSLVFQHFFRFSTSQGKTYTEGVVGDIVHLNPVFTEYSEADADISSLIFSGLVHYNAATGTFDEDLATHTLSEDHLVYTFTLKNGLLWQDGQEVTADDVYFTFAEVIQAPDFENAALKANFDGVKIEKLNSRAVTFTLSSPNSFFFTAMTVGLLPKHLLADVPVADLDTDDFNKMPVGTGPYQVTAPYELNEDGSSSVTLARFEAYYGAKPKIAQLRFVAYPTITDLITNRETWHGAAHLRQSLLEEMDLSDLVTYQYELPQYTAIFFNTDSKKLDQNKERLGISKAIDKQAILDAVGYTVQIDTPLLELSQGEWLNQKDEEEAKGALFDAGWEWNEGDAYRTNSEGETLTLRLLRRDFSGTNLPQEEMARLTTEAIQKQLAAVGVEVVVESYPSDQLETKIQDRDYDMLLYGQSLGYNLDTFSYWHSSQATKTGLNLSNYINPSADMIIEKIRGSFDESQRQELMQALAKTIATDVPAVFLYTPTYYYAVSARVTGVSFEKLLLPKDRFSNIAKWEFN